MSLTTTSVPVPRLRRPASALEFLPAALEIMDTPASPAARYTALTIGGFFVIALTWSIVGKVDIIASAPGTVIPAGKSKVVQPLEAGIVTSILVSDGDHVRAGQPLIELDAAQTGAERDRLAGDLRKAWLDVAGLSALRASLTSGDALASFTAPVGVSAAELEVERATMLTRAQEQAGKIGSLVQQIAGKQAEAAENNAGIAKLRSSLPFVQQKRDMYRTLMRTQLAPVPSWADAEQAAIEQQQQILVLGEHAGSVTAERAALLRELAEARANYAHDLLKDIGDTEQKVEELSNQYTAALRKAQDTVLRAPIDGTVQELAAHTVGGVVTSAQALMTVVPDGGPMVIEATVENKDVGFVHPGQDVQVKVETFTFTRYGLMHGHVIDVSHDAAAPAPKSTKNGSEDKRAAAASDYAGASSAVYVAHVALDHDRIIVDGHDQEIEPGMAVTAEIKTGQRHILDYLLSPLRSLSNTALTER